MPLKTVTTRLRHGLLLALVLALIAGITAPARAAEPTPTTASAPVAAAPQTGPEDDEAAFNRELVQDIADHAEDVEVRDAAKAALATNDPAKIVEYLDVGDAVAKKAAADRKKRVAAQNRALVAEWAKNAGPTAKARAAELMKSGDDAKIADFVAFGKDLADAEDRQTVEDAAAEAKRIESRVVDMVARGGPEVQVAGQLSLDSGDPGVIKEFFTTGYAAANKRDADARAAIEAAQTARAKALDELKDLADRSARAADARTQILKASVQAVKLLTDTASAMGFANKAAKQADKIFEEDKPGRASGHRGRAPELAEQVAEARRQFDQATATGKDATAAAALADTASQQLKETGFTHGVEWAQVTKAVAAAAQAAVKAAETSWHAAEATEATSKALDANANAQVHADNAAKYRQSAEEHARLAHDLEVAAQAQAIAASDAAARGHDARLKAEQAEQAAWAHAANARAALTRARAQRAIAAKAMAGAITQGAIANSSGRRAVEQQNIAVDHAGKAIDAQNTALDMGKRFVDAGNKANDAGTRAAAAAQALKAVEFRSAAADALAADKAGSDESDIATQAALRARDEVNIARPAADQSRREADTSYAAAGAAGADSDRAAAAAKAAKAAAADASREAAKAHEEAARSIAEADRANTEAVTANTDAQAAVNLAQAALEEATKAKSDAELTKAEAWAAAGEAVTASIQARVAGRAALAARVSAAGIAGPAAQALDLAGPLAETDSDAALAADVASTALVIGEDQATAAKNHADQADQAAKEAADAAVRALAEIAPAYQAAANAAESAAHAVRSAQAAIESAKAAAADAAAARDAAHRAGYADAQARQDSVAAHGAAADAANSAAIARQAYNQARSDAANANTAATTAGAAADQADRAATVAEELATEIGPSAMMMREQQHSIEDLLPVMNDVEKQQARSKWADGIKHYLDEKIPGTLINGALSEIVDMGYGLWTLGLCRFSWADGTGNIASRAQACQSIVDGFKQVVANPGLLLHLDTWQADPGKALGMIVVDIGLFFIPGGGALKLAEGVGKAVGEVATAVGATAAKAIAKLVIEGVVKVGAAKLGELLGDLGAIAVAKVLLRVAPLDVIRAVEVSSPRIVIQALEKLGTEPFSNLIRDTPAAGLGKALEDAALKTDEVPFPKPVALDGWVSSSPTAVAQRALGYGKPQIGLDLPKVGPPSPALKGVPRGNPAYDAVAGPNKELTGADLDAFNKKWASGVDPSGYPKLNYPPIDGFETAADRIPDWAIPGERLDRIGTPAGKFLAAEGTPWAERALPPYTLGTEYHVYEVVKEFPVFRGPAASWFGQPGKGIQLFTGDTMSVTKLLEAGYLKEIPL
jgi:hypothetical protein